MSKQLAVKEETFIVEMPDEAPALGFDPTAENFNWREVLPSNFWSMELLEEYQEQNGGWPSLTPARIVVKPVYDPSEFEGKTVPQSELAPKIVLEFEESSPALVFNKSRCEMATKLTGTPNPARWAGLLPKLIVANGVFNKKAQIVIEAVPNGDGPKSRIKSRPGKDVDDVNSDLFGE